MQSCLTFCRIGIQGGFELDRPTAARLQQLVATLDQQQLQGDLGPAIVATLSADTALQQTLLQGMCYFTLAAGKADHSREVATFVHSSDQHQMQIKGQEEQAQQIAAVVEASIVKSVQQVSRKQP